MKKWLRRLVRKLLKHIDSYLTILVAVVVAVLSLLEVIPASRIAPLTLAVLAVLAYTLLNNRQQSESTAEKLDRLQDRLDAPASADEILKPIDTWPSVPSLLEHCQELYVTGKDLHPFLTTYYGDLEQAARNGTRFRFMMVDPRDPELIRILCACSFLFYDLAERKGLMEHSILLLRRLIKAAPGGSVQVRLLPCIPAVSYLIADACEDHGHMTVTMYGYKTPRADRRYMALTRATDPDTFDLHLRQFEAMWQGAQELPPAATAP
jgi:hypothetical protein